MTLRVASLHYYPVKGCRGRDASSLTIDDLGVVGDRRFMLVDPSGRFLSQREEPRLTQLEPEIDGVRLVLRAPHAKAFALEADRAGTSREVRVWDDTFRATDQGDRAAAWCSAALGRPVRLVWFGPGSVRDIDSRYTTRAGAQTTFTDAYPLLAVTSASLAELNGRLREPVPMSRFRPNVVIDGAGAWDEDRWSEMMIGDMTFDAVKPCARCVVTTTDQHTGDRHPNREPLRTLASYRTIPGMGAIFGQNLIPRATGTIALGAQVRA